MEFPFLKKIRRWITKTHQTYHPLLHTSTCIIIPNKCGSDPVYCLFPFTYAVFPVHEGHVLAGRQALRVWLREQGHERGEVHRVVRLQPVRRHQC